MADIENTTIDTKDYCLQQVRDADLDRYYCCLFAPANVRDALFAVLAFNQEVTKTRAVVSEPMLGEIRLQWWREALEEVQNGTIRAHPVVEALAAIEGRDRVFPYLHRIIDGWSDDLQPAAKSGVAYLDELSQKTGGSLHQAMLAIIEPDANDAAFEAARHVGAAWSLLASVRGLEAEIRNGTMPELEGLGGDALDKRMQDVVRDMAEQVEAHLRAAEGHRSPVLAVSALCRRHLGALKRADHLPTAYFMGQPGQLASLWSVMRYNVF